LRFLRLKLLPTVFLNVVTAVLISEADPDPVLLLLLLAQATALFCFGMGLNDRVDIDRDRQNAALGVAMPRPLATGEMTLPTANRLLSAFLALFFALSYLIYLLKGEEVLGGLAVNAGTLCCILLYNLGLKMIPLLGPLCMGCVRGFLIVGATTTAAGELPEINSIAIVYALAMLLYITSVTHFSMEEERARPSALFWRSFGVLVVFTISFGGISLHHNTLPEMDSALIGIIANFLLGWSIHWRGTQYSPFPPRQITPQRHTLLYLAGMTWIDFHYLSASCFDEWDLFVVLQIWVPLWCLWMIYGLGFRNRAIQSGP